MITSAVDAAIFIDKAWWENKLQVLVYIASKFAWFQRHQLKDLLTMIGNNVFYQSHTMQFGMTCRNDKAD